MMKCCHPVHSTLLLFRRFTNPVSHARSTFHAHSRVKKSILTSRSRIMADDDFEQKDRKLVTCLDVQPGSAVQFKLTGLPATPFCDFVETAGNKPHVVGFFREVAEELETTRGLRDFHLKIRDHKKSSSGFVVDVYYGDPTIAGPVQVLPGECISCDFNTPLYPGELPVIPAGACVLPQFNDQPYVHCHLDAKARPGFIVTPKRHVERLSEMDDEEVYALWTIAVRALREDSIPYRTMIVNHGTYRNLPHLHLKIWVTEEDHMTVRQHWPPEKQELWTTLQTLAASHRKRRNVACCYFQRNGSCRSGAQCKFEHI